MSREITGIMIYYYQICKRKLWYFSNGINMEYTSEDVAIGKTIDEECYANEDKHMNIRNVINIDYIKNKKIIHEVKKSRAIEEAAELQVKYYIWFLKKEGIDGVKGMIDYPLLRMTIDVELTEEDEERIPVIIEEINKIIDLEVPPALNKTGICNKCAYHDICMI